MKNKKPIKAVLGVLALGAAGAIGAKKLMKKKSSTVSPDDVDDVKYSLKDKNMLTNLFQKATKQEATKMNKGGGMDAGAAQGKVDRIRAAYKFAEKNKSGDRLTQADIKNAKEVLSLRKAYKFAKENKGEDRLTQADIENAKKATKMNKGGGMDMGQMPNTVKPRPRGNPGIVETVVGKGGDYIKDLID